MGPSYKFKHWLKPLLILSFLFLLTWFLPKEPIDPWNLFSPKKAVSVIFALALIQALSSLLIQWLGSRAGIILSGFLGGLISSTATTATLARKSQLTQHKNTWAEGLMFLSATMAMLVEGIAVVLFGIDQNHLTLLIIFAVPLVACASMILALTKKHKDHKIKIESVPLELLPILKLSAFILTVLALSKVLQNFLGESGLFLLTFLVSLFEVHGSLIANTQLHVASAINLQTLGILIALSVSASFLSKLFLIYSLGSRSLLLHAAKMTAALVISLALSVATFLFLAQTGGGL